MQWLKCVNALIIIILILSVSPTAFSSQKDTLYIDLMTALQIAGKQAPDELRAQWSEQSAYLNWRKARSEWFLPRVDLSLQTPSIQEIHEEDLIYNDSSGNYDRIWYRFEESKWLGNLGITQPLPTGGNVQVYSTLYQRLIRRDIAGLQYDENEVSQAYQVLLSQDLLNGNQYKLAEEQAKISLDQAKWGGTWSRNRLAFRILSSYYTLLTLERELLISTEDLEASRETAQLTRRKFEAGLIPQSEALQLEVEVLQKEASLTRDQANIETQLDQFRKLLGLDLDLLIKVTGEPGYREIDIDLDESIEIAFNNRVDLRQSTAGVRLAEFELLDIKRRYNPRGTLSAFYNLDNREEVWEESFSNKFNDFNINRGLGISLAIPIWSAGRRSAAVQQSEISLRRSTFDKEEKRKDIILEVREAVRNVEETKLRYKTNLKSLELAELSYDITRDRFENGQVNAREWIEAQLSLKRNKVNALRSLIDHTLAVASFRLATGNDVIQDIAE